MYKENQQLTQLNVELAENKKALEDKINNWKAENEKLRKAIAERQTTLHSTNADSALGEEEVAAPGKSISATVAAPSKSSSSSAVEVGFEIIVQEKEGNAETILKSLMSTAPEQMLKVLNNSGGINMLKQVTYLSAPKIREVLATESTISLEAIPRVPKTEEQLVKEKRQIENANDAVKAATSASQMLKLKLKEKFPKKSRRRENSSRKKRLALRTRSEKRLERKNLHSPKKMRKKGSARGGSRQARSESGEKRKRKQTSRKTF